MQEQELIAVRIKDGIFVGNMVAAEDREFLGMNKITHIVNCAGGEVPEYFAGDAELKYLSLPWRDTGGSVCTTALFDEADDTVTRVVAFIDAAVAVGDCVLVHSFHGISRGPLLVAAYFIVKYGWKMESALSFIEMAHPDVNIKPHFLRQLRLLAARHAAKLDIFDKDVDDSQFGLDNDQWMLRNTLLNGLPYEVQANNALHRQCTTSVDVGNCVPSRSNNGDTKRWRVAFVDTKKGTSMESLSSTPVVNSIRTHQHLDPTTTASTGFFGAQGPLALHSGLRSPSILSRSISPCTRHLESDPRLCPKGRQVLPLVKKSTPANPPTKKASTDRKASIIGNTPIVLRTNSSTSQSTTEDKTQARQGPSQPSKQLGYKRLAPPAAGGQQARSPFATLTPSHKYRNGSPLPLTKGSASADNKLRIKIPSTMVRSGSRTDSEMEAPRRTTSQIRTGSPLSLKVKNQSALSRGGSPSSKTIAPHRTDATEPTWNASRIPESARPTVRRQLSPALRASSIRGRSSDSRKASPGKCGSSSAKRGSPNGQLTSKRETGSPYARTSQSSRMTPKQSHRDPYASRKPASSDSGSFNTSETICRQPPSVISSRRV